MTLTAADSGVLEPVAISRPATGQLGHLGVEPAEEAAYRAALGRPSWTVAELALRLGMPVARVAEVVSRLVELDLVRVNADGTRLRPVDPQLALTALIARREAEMVNAMHELERARLAAADLAADFNPAQRGHLDGALDVAHGPAAVRARVTALVSQARTEVVSMMLSGSGHVDPIAPPRLADLADPASGVRVRTVATSRARQDPLTLRHLRGVAADGAEVRTAVEVPMSALVVDRVTAVFPLTGRRVGAVVLRLPSVVVTTLDLFERVWAEATPLEDTTNDYTPDERERDLLALMLAGCTDKTAAGKMRLSVRTVRRMVSKLNDQLGARGRFQAGALAAERGWITKQMLRDRVS